MKLIKHRKVKEKKEQSNSLRQSFYA